MGCLHTRPSLGLGQDFSWLTYKHMNERERQSSEYCLIKELYKQYVEQRAANGLGPNSYFNLTYIYTQFKSSDCGSKHISPRPIYLPIVKLAFGAFRFSCQSGLWPIQLALMSTWPLAYSQMLNWPLAHSLMSNQPLAHSLVSNWPLAHSLVSNQQTYKAYKEISNWTNDNFELSILLTVIGRLVGLP